MTGLPRVRRWHKTWMMYTLIVRCIQTSLDERTWGYIDNKMGRLSHALPTCMTEKARDNSSLNTPKPIVEYLLHRLGASTAAFMSRNHTFMHRNDTQVT